MLALAKYMHDYAGESTASLKKPSSLARQYKLSIHRSLHFICFHPIIIMQSFAEIDQLALKKTFKSSMYFNYLTPLEKCVALLNKLELPLTKNVRLKYWPFSLERKKTVCDPSFGLTLTFFTQGSLFQV